MGRPRACRKLKALCTALQAPGLGGQGRPGGNTCPRTCTPSPCARPSTQVSGCRLGGECSAGWAMRSTLSRGWAAVPRHSTPSMCTCRRWAQRRLPGPGRGGRSRGCPRCPLERCPLGAGRGPWQTLHGPGPACGAGGEADARRQQRHQTSPGILAHGRRPFLGKDKAPAGRSMQGAAPTSRRYTAHSGRQ